MSEARIVPYNLLVQWANPSLAHNRGTVVFTEQDQSGHWRREVRGALGQPQSTPSLSR